MPIGCRKVDRTRQNKPEARSSNVAAAATEHSSTYEPSSSSSSSDEENLKIEKRSGNGRIHEEESFESSGSSGEESSQPKKRSIKPKSLEVVRPKEKQSSPQRQVTQPTPQQHKEEVDDSDVNDNGESSASDDHFSFQDDSDDEDYRAPASDSEDDDEDIDFSDSEGNGRKPTNAKRYSDDDDDDDSDSELSLSSSSSEERKPKRVTIDIKPKKLPSSKRRRGSTTSSNDEVLSTDSVEQPRVKRLETSTSRRQAERKGRSTAKATSSKKSASSKNRDRNAASDESGNSDSLVLSNSSSEDAKPARRQVKPKAKSHSLKTSARRKDGRIKNSTDDEGGQGLSSDSSSSDDPRQAKQRSSSRSGDTAKRNAKVSHKTASSRRGSRSSRPAAESSSESEYVVDGSESLSSSDHAKSAKRRTPNRAGRPSKGEVHQKPVSSTKTPSRKLMKRHPSLYDESDDEDTPVRTSRITPEDKAQSYHGEEDIDDSRSESSDHSGVGIVRDGDVGVADDSSDDESAPKASHASPSRYHGNLLDEYDTDGDVEKKPSSYQIDSPRSLPDCPSTHDAITAEELPRGHVCYITPDGSERFCFALETLRQISLTSSSKKYNEDGSVAFLQPLHFRSQMSSDLIDQIASRFGRNALDINGPYYSKRMISVDGISFNDTHASDRVYNRSSFSDRVFKFVSSIMGTRDLYTCPLCYTAAYHRMRNGASFDAQSKAKSRILDSYTSLFHYDPMTILGSIDDNEFGVAATFCFSSASKIKKHLRADHGVIPRKMNGKELFERFSIRKQDGLLQRYVRAVGSPSRVNFQGDLQRYWFDGNNFDFVHLLEMVDKADEYRSIHAKPWDYEHEQAEEAESFLEKGFEFFHSIRKEVGELWENISAPYRLDEQDIHDFIQEGSASDQDDEGERAENRQFMQEDAEAELADIENQAARYEEMDANNDELEEDEESVFSKDELQHKASSSESEDSWMQDKRKSMEKIRKGRRSHSQTKTPKRRAKASDEDSAVEYFDAIARRYTLDENDSDFKPVATRPSRNRSQTNSQKAAKRKSIQSSDEE